MVATPSTTGEGPVGKDCRAAADAARPAPDEDGREAAGEAPMLEDYMVAASSRPAADEV